MPFLERHSVQRGEVSGESVITTQARVRVPLEIRPHVDAWEDAGHFPDELFRRCGELGFLGLHYPQEWGGSGYSTSEILTCDSSPFHGFAQSLEIRLPPLSALILSPEQSHG